MSYVSLYRKYRPRTFSDVVGQDHVTRTLANAINEDRLSHAYLFAGPRGTGKTSTARILAKAINCVKGPTAEPCDVCEHCVAITDGTAIDVIELDMASHGGVDDARELRERALFSPASARRKVYILDEVHMASTAAFNALLKLIEEPPDHVLFAMATTDPQKVIPTILSRVQRLDLRRVTAVDVAAHLTRICEAEGYAIDDDALAAVVRAGEGSVRDTLSVLEQVLAYAGRDVHADDVARTLGTTPAQQVLRTVELVAGRDVAGLLELVHGLLESGHDLRRFTADLVGHLRDLLVTEVADGRPQLVDATEQWRQRLVEQSGLLGPETLLRAVRLLAETLAEQRRAAPRLPLELALATLATPTTSGDVGELADRLARLERRLDAGQPAGGPAPAAPTAATARTASPEPAPAEPGVAADPDPAADQGPPGPEGEPAPGAGPPPAAEAPDAGPPPDVGSPPDVGPAPHAAPATDERPDPTDESVPAGGGDELEVVRAHWQGVLELLKERSRRYHAIFEPAEPVGVGRDILTLRFGPRYAAFHAVQARGGELSGALTEALQQACGLRLKIDVKVDGDDMRRRPMPPSVTPDDARTPVAGEVAHATDAEDGVRGGPSGPDEGDDVREAEHGHGAATDDVDALLSSELGAELVEEHPAEGDQRRA